MDYHALIARIQETAKLRFGSIFDRSIDLFKKVWLQGLMTMLITIGLIVPIQVLVYLPLLAAGITDPDVARAEGLPPMVTGIYMLIIPLFFFVVMALSTLLLAAFLRICRLKDEGVDGPDAYFYYFKAQFVGKALLLGLISMGLSLLGMLACGIGLIYLVVPFSLFPAFFAFQEDLDAMQIVRAALALAHKNWWVCLGLIIVTGLMAELGVLLCVIGVFVTGMFAKIPLYFMYKDGVGFPDTE